MGEQAAKWLFAFSELRRRTIVARIKRLEDRVRAVAARRRCGGWKTPRVETALGTCQWRWRSGCAGRAGQRQRRVRSAGVSPVCGQEARVPAPIGLAAAVLNRTSLCDSLSHNCGAEGRLNLPTKHAILSELTAGELRTAVDDHGLSVRDKRVKEQLVGALARTRKVPIGEVLAALSRQRLKGLCRTLGVDDSGKRKAEIAARLIGGPRPARKEKAKARATRPRGAKGPAVERPAPSSKALSVAQLEKHLWAAADILRGSIDSSDYKGYIFGLLFLKRLSDRFEEEAEKLIAEGQPEALVWQRDSHQFFVPDRARWNAIQKTATNIGECLNKACAALEEENSGLEGVLAGIDYNDEHRLGDGRQRDNVLARLVQHFSEISLRNDSMAEPDMLGRAYEYLIEQFADDAGKKGGEFYTPRMVVRLIVELLAPKETMRICDPTVGSGGMLIECAHYVQRHRGNPRNLTVHGQEKNLGTWAICKMNMLLHGLPDARIEKEDTIRTPKLVEDGELRLYDRVIANPPFSLDEWGRDEAENDRFGRFRFGLPPKTKGDFAFVQHMVAVLNTNGRLGVVMPHGVLFRGGSEARIRQGMLQEDLFEAVIGLAPNLFYGTSIPAAILVLNRSKPPRRRRKVLFIDASGAFEEGGSQNRLREKDVRRIAQTFRANKDVERFARVVPLREIEQSDWNLNISRYVDTQEEEERIDLAGAVRALREMEHQRAAAEATMNAHLAELGYAD